MPRVEGGGIPTEVKKNIVEFRVSVGGNSLPLRWVDTIHCPIWSANMDHALNGLLLQSETQRIPHHLVSRLLISWLIWTRMFMTRFVPSVGMRAEKTRTSLKCAGTYTDRHWHRARVAGTTAECSPRHCWCYSANPRSLGKKGGRSRHLPTDADTHNCFNEYLNKIGREETAQCYHCAPDWDGRGKPGLPLGESLNRHGFDPGGPWYNMILRPTQSRVPDRPLAVFFVKSPHISFSVSEDLEIRMDFPPRQQKKYCL